MFTKDTRVTSKTLSKIIVKSLIIKSEAHKTNHKKITHIKTEILHTYPKLHVTLYKKDKEQAVTPIQKAPIHKTPINNNHYKNRVSGI